MNEGFKALPEYVQRKISPDMAKKYMGGGAVMQRPLFRQMGGPAQPMPQDVMPAQPMPQAAAPAPQMGPEDALMQVEGEMENVGREYLNQMMGGIDNADDVMSMINALRGNEAPLESRYAELAQYVGEADAQKTPESVLAMVQPTIMMTEEGAIDSGIGQLMQEIAGSDMEDTSGNPTQMAQGVGQLMAMGAGNTPPANFSQGGPVHLQQGGDPSLEQMYQDRLKMRQDILGGQDRAGEVARAQSLGKSKFYFDLANAALAAGAPTAQPMSFAERLMMGAQQADIFGNLSKSAEQVEAVKRAQSAEDKQMALSALTSAEGAFETAQQRALELQKQQNQFAQELTIQTNKFKHDISLQDDAQSHAATMQSNSEELQKALVKLQGNETQAAIQLRGKLQKELAKTNADIQINNQLRAMKQANVYDIAKMDKGLEQSQALASYNATLDRIATDSQRAFTATQNALNRALQEKLQLDSQDFEGTLRENLLQMQLDDNEINRQVAKVQNDIANAFRADDALRADQALAVDQLRLQYDQDYRANQQVIDEYKAETARIKEERLSEEGKSVTVPAGASVYKDGVLQFTAPKDASASTKVLGPGEILVDGNGKELARGPAKPADTGKTEPERLRFAITDQATLDALAGGTLEGEKLNRFYGDLQAYIRPQIDPKTGATSQFPIPPGTQKVLQDLQAAGQDVPINPTLYGGQIQTNDLLELSSQIMDPTVDLRQGTGLLSGLARGINWAGSQIAGETGLGKGVLFKDTAEGSAALNSLAQFTERFYIEGRTLAREFENLQAELVRPSAIRTDSQALEKLSSQRNLLDAYDRRLEAIVTNPRSYTEAQVAKANDMKLYLSQLLGAYDTAISIYEGGPQTSLEGKPDPASFRRN
jgi:hypothetical protein